MWLFIKLAFRNIFRNKRRTILSGLAIGIGLAALIFSDALMEGMEKSMIKSATTTFLGEAQINAKGFRTNMEVEKTVNNYHTVIKSIKSDKYIKNYTLRTQAFGMLTSASNANSIMVIGIAPFKERNISILHKVIKKGTYLSNNKQNQILIGEKLANVLEVDVGDKVVLTMAQAKTGDLSQELFRVAGIFEFNIRDMDKSIVFININKAQKLLKIGNNVHQIVINFVDLSMAQDRSLPIWKKYSKYNNEISPWTKLLPELNSMVNSIDFMLWILAILLFSIVAVGIMNTLFMSLYERIFEFGILRAIGTRPIYLGIMVVSEAGFLALISIVIGVSIGLSITYYFAINGIDYLGTEYVGVTINNLIYPILNIRQYTLFPFMLMIFTMAISLYPAVHAARLTPAKAVKHNL